MKSLLLAALITVFMVCHGSSQTTIYTELLGAGFSTASINVDFRIKALNNHLGVRAGWSYKDGTSMLDYNIPLQVNYLLFASAHKLELAAGTTYFKTRTNDLGVLITSGIHANCGVAYRYQSESGFLFRSGITYFATDGGIFWPGLAIGYKF